MSNGTCCGNSNAWSETIDTNAIATECVKMLVKVVRPVRSRVHGRFLEARGTDDVDPDQIRIRTVFALRFGHLRAENDENISEDMVRAAFNSPFRPFVLTSTSIGQEGLDFHPWCHRLVHWNLPGNPVDLEQREGRVHRYKGHAVRRNVAAVHGKTALESWRPGDDLWTSIFQRADQTAREAGASDLVPHWIAFRRLPRRAPRPVAALREGDRSLSAFEAAASRLPRRLRPAATGRADRSS